MSDTTNLTALCTTLIGQDMATAQQTIEARECSMRRTMQDGEYFIVTRDCRGDRINVHIMQGLVTKAYVG